jgi:hypothetical protein
MKGGLGATLVAAAMLAGCSSAKVYPEVRPANLHVRTETSPTQVRAEIHIHRVDADCRTQYEGTVPLDRPVVELGVPAGRTSVVAVTFSTSSMLRGSRSSVRYATLLTPRAGHRYDVKVTYRENLYDVVIRENDPRGSSSRQLARRDPAQCKAS